ncbi:hypothetical protein ABIE27_005049 [Paenibacillus sp. 4624]|uniref:hypothetical protein n=1 Tax=Paenibacillus sp. 4624 TaxID=3156453 RepID=UPI003D1C9E2D
MEVSGYTMHLDDEDFREIERIKSQNPGYDYMEALNARSIALTGVNVKRIKDIKTNDTLRELHGNLFRILEEALRNR